MVVRVHRVLEPGLAVDRGSIANSHAISLVRCRVEKGRTPVATDRSAEINQTSSLSIT